MAPVYLHTDLMVTSLLFTLTIPGLKLSIAELINFAHNADVKNCLQIGIVKGVMKYVPEEMGRREEMITQ